MPNYALYMPVFSVKAGNVQKSPHIECGKMSSAVPPMCAVSGFVNGDFFRAKSAPEGAPMRLVLIADGVL